MNPHDPTRSVPPDVDATRSHKPQKEEETRPRLGDSALEAGMAAAFGNVSTSGHSLDPAAGTILACRYKLIESIGEGGMGSVWVAEQTEPVKRKVAIKLIKVGMDSKAVLARFEAERQALAVMDHPNIAKVLDGGLHDGKPFFVMELVKGVSITKFCDERRLTPQQRLELFVPVCEAIQHAHQKGIIHRDIKPSNVLVALSDDKPNPKVIDFGIAKATTGTLTEHTLETNFGAVVGTPQYMSPEQASFNNLDIDTRSDMYSLGVLLYELLTGSPPFQKVELEKRGLLEILRVVREEEPPRPSTKLSTAAALPSIAATRGIEPKKLTGLLRNELDWIVMKALEKDRARRYETANGFAADVLRYLGGKTVQAHPPSKWYQVRKFVRRNKIQVTAVAFVFLALVAGIVGTSLGLDEAARQKRNADDAAGREKARAEGEEKAKLDALDQKAVAEGQKKLAEERKQLAEDEADRARYLAATNSLILAQNMGSAFDVSGANDVLDSIPHRYRGWTWNYLQRAYNGGLFKLNGHTLPVRSMSYSPNGDRLVTAGEDGTVRVWDARTGSELVVFRGHDMYVVHASFSPDGKFVASRGRVVGAKALLSDVVTVWEATTGKVVASIDLVNALPKFAFSVDSKRFICLVRT